MVEQADAMPDVPNSDMPNASKRWVTPCPLMPSFPLFLACANDCDLIAVAGADPTILVNASKSSYLRLNASGV
eukprot:3210387-Pyramimonas_sp.AAC.1